MIFVLFPFLVFSPLLILFVVLFIKYPRYIFDKFAKLVIIFGPKGSGKTTAIVCDGLHWLSRGHVVYSNVRLPFFRYFDVKNLSKSYFPAGSVVYWDEAALDADNRNYKNFDSAWTELLRLQRHFGFRLIAFSQSYDLDKKIRDMADQLYIIRKVLWWSVLNPVNKKIVCQNDTVTGTGKITEQYKYGSIFDHKIIFLPAWRQYYDTYDKDSFASRSEMIYETIPATTQQKQDYKKRFKNKKRKKI